MLSFQKISCLFFLTYFIYSCFLSLTSHLGIHFINTNTLTFNDVELRVNPSKETGSSEKKESLGRPGLLKIWTYEGNNPVVKEIRDGTNSRTLDSDTEWENFGLVDPWNWTPGPGEREDHKEDTSNSKVLPGLTLTSLSRESPSRNVEDHHHKGTNN